MKNGHTGITMKRSIDLVFWVKLRCALVFLDADERAELLDEMRRTFADHRYD
jgi:hypothetical protein